MELMAEVRWENQGASEAAEAGTEDISRNGVLLTMPGCPEPETPITFTIFFPAQITGTSVELVGRGRVVRQGQAGKLGGIAAVIEEYELRTPVADA